MADMFLSGSFSPVEFIVGRDGGDVLHEFFPSDRFVSGRCGRQIDFGYEEVGLPADHALEDFDGVQREMFVGQKVAECQVDVDEGEGHGVAAYDPAAVGGEIFIAGSIVSKKGGQEPYGCHYAKPQRGRCAGRIGQSQRQDEYGAAHTAQHVPFAERSVNMGALLAQIGVEQEGAKDYGWQGGNDVQDQKQVVDQVHRKERRCMPGVGVEVGIQCIGEGYAQDQKGCDGQGFERPRHACDVDEGDVTGLEKTDERVHAVILHEEGTAAYGAEILYVSGFVDHPRIRFTNSGDDGCDLFGWVLL